MSADGANIRLIVELLNGAAQLGLQNACGYICFFFVSTSPFRPCSELRLQAKAGGADEGRWQMLVPPPASTMRVSALPIRDFKIQVLFVFLLPYLMEGTFLNRSFIRFRKLVGYRWRVRKKSHLRRPKQKDSRRAQSDHGFASFGGRRLSTLSSSFSFIRLGLRRCTVMAPS